MKKHIVPILLVTISTALLVTLYKTNFINKVLTVNSNKDNQEKVKIVKPKSTNTSSVTEEPKDTEISTEKSNNSNSVREINGLVLVSSLDNSILIDLRYATTNNFTGKVVYPVNVCVLQKETAQKLINANNEFKKNGYRIKIWDAYRPVYVQKIFWNIVKDSRFVANPYNGGSIHNKGTAVDVTLVDPNGNELVMPSKFDDFSINATRSNPNISTEAKKNMDYLTEVMDRNGFNKLDTEWWHYEDSNSAKYKIIDVSLDEFLK